MNLILTKQSNTQINNKTQLRFPLTNQNEEGNVIPVSGYGTPQSCRHRVAEHSAPSNAEHRWRPADRRGGGRRSGSPSTPSPSTAPGRRARSRPRTRSRGRKPSSPPPPPRCSSSPSEPAAASSTPAVGVQCRRPWQNRRRRRPRWSKRGDGRRSGTASCPSGISRGSAFR